MDKTAAFSIAVGFYVYIFIISATKVSENDVIKPPKELTNHIPVDIFVNKEYRFNNSKLKTIRADECKCKNGKCMRACDVTKTTRCEDQRMVCVCNPEFGKTSDDECEYCDCGQGINCTFTRNVYGVSSANCICPEGYYKDYYPYNAKCKLKCSSERHCQNGGTCNWYNRCECPSGTKGDLCEEIDDCSSKCENRFEVDCLYNERYRIAYCDCKNWSLYFDQEANICKPCPCENGFCDYEFNYLYRKLICRCNYGYKKFNGYCKKCDCGIGAIGQCEFDSRGGRICKCGVGFFEREGRCLVVVINTVLRIRSAR
ncbi:unnamed protein product [Larinioides sclopetarius]|uniref:EGF-like domain-containing protein n=1 Tax=Larinioides sclopetarius TaxID=280406 RepID=A0AAV2BKX9_9ARAC